MSTSSSDVDSVWSQITPPAAGLLNGRLLTPNDAQYEAWAAIDSSHHHHLLVEVPDDCEPLEDRTRGLAVSIDELQIGPNSPATYIDLQCANSALNSTFSAVVADVVNALAGDASKPREVVARCLERWKWFWRTETVGLSTEAALGLLGELWFMTGWLSPITIDTLRHWLGPSRYRHDFQWPSLSVEVKCSSVGVGARPLHRINQLAQLEDPEQGDLYLFSLHLSRDDLANNSLPLLVNSVRADLELRDPAAAGLFLEKLAEVGYSPDMEEAHSQTYRVISEGLYEVNETFPRLTEDSFVNGVPASIGNVSYVLDLAGCEDWKLGTSPSDFDLPTRI